MAREKARKLFTKSLTYLLSRLLTGCHFWLIRSYAQVIFDTVIKSLLSSLMKHRVHSTHFSCLWQILCSDGFERFWMWWMNDVIASVWKKVQVSAGLRSGPCYSAAISAATVYRALGVRWAATLEKIVTPRIEPRSVASGMLIEHHDSYGWQTFSKTVQLISDGVQKRWRVVASDV